MEPTARGSALVPKTRDRAGPLLLLIDDDAALRQVLRLALEEAGYRVLAAANGGDGLRLLAASRPKLVLLDLLLPDVPGWDLVATIRAAPATAGLPVIASSASRRALRERGAWLRDWGCALLPRPFDLEELLGTVARLVAHARGPGQGPRRPIGPGDERPPDQAFACEWWPPA